MGLCRITSRCECPLASSPVLLLTTCRAAHPTGSSVLFLSGFGFLSRLHGLSVDNLVEVEMVLADGSIIIVSEEEHPGKSYPPICVVMITEQAKELWWAIRGAGPAFGIATRFKVKAFPVPVCFAGNLI